MPSTACYHGYPDGYVAGGPMDEVSIAQARDELTSLLRRSETGRIIRITRRGKPVAVLISEREYQRLVAAAVGRRDFWEAVSCWRRDVQPEDDLTPEEVASWRDSSAGREPPWKT